VIQKIRGGIDKHPDEIEGARGEAMICDSDNWSCAVPPKTRGKGIDFILLVGEPRYLRVEIANLRKNEIARPRYLVPLIA
jgi:hypothetical protein